MKKLGYYPALVFILFVCATIAGAFVFLSAETLKRMSGYKGSDATYKESLKQLNDEKTAMENNQQADRNYEDYFNRWRQKEGILDESKLKEVFQKTAEELGVTIYEVVPLNSPEKDDGSKSAQTKGQRKQRPLPLPGAAPVVGAPPGGISNPRMPGQDMVELRVVLLGPFSQLMTWLERAENDLGGLRIVRTSWVARSTEEVKLTVGLRYKTVGGTQ